MVFGKKVLLNQVISDIKFNIYHMRIKNFIEFIKEGLDEKELESDISNKFIKYVVKLPEFIETNKEWLSKDIENDDDHIHTYSLFNNWATEVYDEEDDKYLNIDESIKYFIMSLYVDGTSGFSDFHVYENGEFRQANDEEDHYFRTLDNEIQIGSQDSIESIDYSDWKKSKDKTKEAIFKINEE